MSFKRILGFLILVVCFFYLFFGHSMIKNYLGSDT